MVESKPTRPIAPNPYDYHPAPATFTLTSADLADGAQAPLSVVGTDAGGGNRSPQLSWSGAPAETKSFVVTCFDIDAPTLCGFWHWLVGDIPATVTGLAANAAAGELPAGAVQLRNDGGDVGFQGIAPPPGDRAHRYVFAVHALAEEDMEFEESDPPAYASYAALDNELARATLTVTYQR